MYKGKPSSGLDFFNLLYQSKEFTSEFGQMILASAKLEAELILLLKKSNSKGIIKKHSLGKLIHIAYNNQLLSDNEFEIFKLLKNQRNYMTHNIYALFNYSTEESILARENLLESDVLYYTETAWEIKENLNNLVDIIKEKNIN